MVVVGGALHVIGDDDLGSKRGADTGRSERDTERGGVPTFGGTCPNYAMLNIHTTIVDVHVDLNTAISLVSLEVPYFT